MGLLSCFCAARARTRARPLHCKIVFLDESELVHEPQPTRAGQALLDLAFRHLNLLETAYFGLRFLDRHGQPHWLDPAKRLGAQLCGRDLHTLYFGVKFYAADPCKLLEELTRYQFFLQTKRDVLQGRLAVAFELAAELGALALQSELGDFDPRRHGPGYVADFRFLPSQSGELELRVAELHRALLGQPPAQAELAYLDKVKWLEMYGVDLHPVLGQDHVDYFLGLTPGGIVVLRDKATVATYYWPRISKVYFKGRFFMLRVAGRGDAHCTYGFETPSKCACKHLWKCCVEHHAFFRLVQVPPPAPDIFALGSRFRYSGRTEKQAVRDAQLQLRQPPPFSRSPSKRYQRRPNGAEPAPPPAAAPLPSSQETKYISHPLPADAAKRGGESPRSARSAPWSQPHSKGLYNSSAPPSPRSVRSGSRYRSSSVDSQSSNDSRLGRRRRQHRAKASDNESEASKGSRRKHRKRRSKSGAEQERGDRKCASGQQAKHRKHRSRSRSPAEAKAWLPAELKQHLEFGLVETSGMSELQLREIPYTVVRTSCSKHVKLKGEGRTDFSLGGGHEHSDSGLGGER